MLIMTSRAVSIATQSDSEVPSRELRPSSSPKSFWHACALVMIATRTSVTFFKMEVSAIRDGPVILRVAARERLISVTVALFEGVSDLLGFSQLKVRRAEHKQ